MLGSSSDPVPDPERWEPPAGDAVAQPIVPLLIAMFELRACWFESFPFDGQLPRIESGRIVLPADEPGVAPWSGEAGIELPVRHRGLTLGRFVLVPAAPTTGVGFSAAARDEAMTMAACVGVGIATVMIAESDGSTSPRRA